ncbi:MAG: phosphomannomutase/phosphoglucomutase [Nitrospira sp.]|nr:phosphomannomutase/phosphoglucomutase [Nitrospira sp.]MCP9442113.1 phosphomannomutase/phosphoglucomutase [Nitrospira sp.]
MGLFREYDLRGVVGQELTEDIAERLGRAYATYVRPRGVTTISVGRDGRTSSPALHRALLKGLLAGGLDVVDLGVCTSPLVYFSLFTLPVGGGIMITGSHNAAEYNGFKICVGNEAIHGEDIQALRRVMEQGAFVSGVGRLSRHEIIPDYLAYLRRSFDSVDAGHLHVVIDCGNGAASLVAKQALELLGCKVTTLYGELDGRFPNHHPDPTVLENLGDLMQAVEQHGADVGIGYDGDADRIGAVDERGEVLWGDKLLVLYSREILAEKPGATIISEVKASQGLYDDVAKHGGRPIMWKTGHSLIKAKMKEESAVLAGEMSGHMFFADRYFGYDDAVYASCRLIEILAKRKKPLSALVADLPPTVVTPEIRVDLPDAIKFEVIRSIQARCERYLQERQESRSDGLRLRGLITIDGVRAIFDDGWGLIRASNTQPALVLRFEAASPTKLDAIRSFIEGELASVRQTLGC